MNISGGLARSLLEERLTHALDIPQSHWKFIVPVLCSLLSTVRWLLSFFPGGLQFPERWGREYWGIAEEILFKIARDRNRSKI